MTRPGIVWALSALAKFRTRRKRWEDAERQMEHCVAKASPADDPAGPQAPLGSVMTREEWEAMQQARLAYPQTWTYMPPNWAKQRVWNQPLRRSHWYPLRRALQGACGILIGHEASRTERGYGGGGMMDQWCRWCDLMFQVPIAEEPSAQWMVEMFDTPPSSIR